ncbi:hypothetical protein V500_10641 [Pseudogymnoascus sp. VKM F-4518 (FW-2643)]|nr:hypothetical protein V500_10641 [Pseudogymnoascus sp. VKM F-4518 (FW-2643)]
MDERRADNSSVTTNEKQTSAMDEDRADNQSVTTEEQTSAMDDDWADNSSVTTDEESPNPPPSKKNIHARRWTLVPKGNDSFVIEGGRKPKTITLPPRSEMLEDQKHLAEADFVLEHLYLTRSPGRNGHVSTGISLGGYISRSLSTMTDEFHHYQNLWLKSPAYTSLRSTILSLKRSQSSHVAIDNIVCLALGSLQGTLEVCRAASLTQLAVLMTIIEDLDLDIQTMAGKFIAQDPVFTHLDTEFLASLGFITLPDPGGFLAITPTTLVFSIAGPDLWRHRGVYEECGGVEEEGEEGG